MDYQLNLRKIEEEIKILLPGREVKIKDEHGMLYIQVDDMPLRLSIEHNWETYKILKDSYGIEIEKEIATNIVATFNINHDE